MDDCKSTRQPHDLNDLYDEEMCFSDISSIHSDCEYIASANETGDSSIVIGGGSVGVSGPSLLGPGSTESLKVTRQLCHYVIEQCEHAGHSSESCGSCNSSAAPLSTDNSSPIRSESSLNAGVLGDSKEGDDLSESSDKKMSGTRWQNSRTPSPQSTSSKLVTYISEHSTSTIVDSHLDTPTPNVDCLVENSNFDDGDDVFNGTVMRDVDVSSSSSYRESVTIHTRLARKISSCAIDAGLLSSDEPSTASKTRVIRNKSRDSKSVSSSDDTQVEIDRTAVYSEYVDKSVAIDSCELLDDCVASDDSISSEGPESVSKHTRLARRLSSNIIEACYNSDSTDVTEAIEDGGRSNEKNKPSDDCDSSKECDTDASTTSQCESVSKCTKLAKRLSSNIIEVCLDSEATSVSTQLESDSKHTKLAKRLSSSAIDACLDTDISITSDTKSSASDEEGSVGGHSADCDKSAVSECILLGDCNIERNIKNSTSPNTFFADEAVQDTGNQEKLPGSISSFRKPIDSSSVRGSMDGSINQDDLNKSLIPADLDASSIRISLESCSIRDEDSSIVEYSDDSYTSSSTSSPADSIKSTDISSIHESMDVSIADETFNEESTIRESIHELSHEMEDKISIKETSVRFTSLNNSPFKNDYSIDASSVLESLDRGEYDYDAIEKLTSQLSAELNIKEDETIDYLEGDKLDYSTIRHGISKWTEACEDNANSEDETSGVVCKSVSKSHDEIEEEEGEEVEGEEETIATDYDDEQEREVDELRNISSVSSSSDINSLKDTPVSDVNSDSLSVNSDHDVLISKCDSLTSSAITSTMPCVFEIPDSKSDRIQVVNDSTVCEDYHVANDVCQIKEPMDNGIPEHTINTGVVATDSTSDGVDSQRSKLDENNGDLIDVQLSSIGYLDDNLSERMVTSPYSQIAKSDTPNTNILIVEHIDEDVAQLDLNTEDLGNNSDYDNNVKKETVTVEHKDDNNLLNIDAAVFDKSIEIESKSVISANVDISISPENSTRNGSIRIFRTLSEELAQTGEIEIHTSPHLSRRPTPDIPREVKTCHDENEDNKDDYPANIMAKLNPVQVIDSSTSVAGLDMTKEDIDTESIASTNTLTPSKRGGEDAPAIVHPIFADPQETVKYSMDVRLEERILPVSQIDESSQNLLDAVDIVLENNSKLMESLSDSFSPEPINIEKYEDDKLHNKMSEGSITTPENETKTNEYTNDGGDGDGDYCNDDDNDGDINKVRQAHLQELASIKSSHELLLADIKLQAKVEMASRINDKEVDYLAQIENLKIENQKNQEEFLKQYRSDLQSRDEEIIKYKELSNDSSKQLELIESHRCEIEQLRIDKSNLAELVQKHEVLLEDDRTKIEAEDLVKERRVACIQSELETVKDQRDTFETTCTSLGEMLTSVLSSFVACEDSLVKLDQLLVSTNELQPYDNIVARRISEEINTAGDRVLNVDPVESTIDSTQNEIDEGFEVSSNQPCLQKMFSEIKNQQILLLAERLQNHGNSIISRIRNYAIEIENIKDDLSQVRKENKIYETELLTAKQHLMQGVDLEIANHVEFLSKRNFELEKQLAVDTSLHNEKMDSLNEQLRAQEDKLTHEIDDIRENLDHTTNQLILSRKYFEEQVAERENERDELLSKDKQLKELTAKLNSNVSKNNACDHQDNAELLELKIKLKTSASENKKNIEDMKSGYEFKLKAFENQIQDSSKKYENEKYKNQVQIEHLNQNIENSKNEIVKNTEINVELTKEKENFQIEIKKLNNDIDDLRSNSKSIHLYNEVCQEMEDLQLNLASEKGKNASQTLAETFLQEEIVNLNEIIKSKQDMHLGGEVEDIIEEKEILNRELNDVKEEVDTLNQKIKDMNNCEIQVNQLNELFMDKTSNYENIILDKDSEIAQLNLKLQAYDTEKAEHIQLSQNLENQENKYILKEKADEDKIIELNTKNSTLSNEITVINKKLESVDEEKSEFKKELSRITELYDLHTKDKDIEINKYKFENEQEKTELQKRISLFESENIELLKQLQDKATDVKTSNLQTDLETEFRKLQQTHDDTLIEQNKLLEIIKENELNLEEKLMDHNTELLKLQKTHDDTLIKQNDLIQTIKENEQQAEDKLIEQNRQLCEKHEDIVAKIEKDNCKKTDDLQKSYDEKIIQIEENLKRDIKRSSDIEISLLESSQEKMDQSTISLTSSSTKGQDDSLTSVLDRVAKEVKINESIDDKLLTCLNSSIYSDGDEHTGNSSSSSVNSCGSLRTLVCKIHSEGMKTLSETELRLLKSYGETSSVPNESIRQKCQDILGDDDRAANNVGNIIKTGIYQPIPTKAEDDSELRKLKMDMKMMEYKLHLETGNSEDLRETLKQEKLSYEVTSNMLKESLAREQTRIVTASTALEEQRTRNLKIEGQLDIERTLNKQIKNNFEAEQVSHKQHIQRAEAMIKESYEHLSEEQERVDNLTISLAKANKLKTEARRQELANVETLLKIDALKQNEISLKDSLKKEKEFTTKLKEIIANERQIQIEIAEKEKIAIFVLEKCLDTERSNVCELNAALADERDRVSKLNKDLRELNENREKLLRNETSHTQVLKSQINSLNSQLIKTKSISDDKFSKLEDDRERLQKSVMASTNAFVCNSDIKRNLAVAQKKIIELQLSEKEAKRNEQIANALLQKAKLQGSNNDLNKELVRLHSELSMAKLRTRDVDDECHRLRQLSTSLNSDADVNRLKMQRIYNKYLKSESFRKSMVWQKKYLLALINGYRDAERKTMDALDNIGYSMHLDRFKYNPKFGRNEFKTSPSNVIDQLKSAQTMNSSHVSCLDNPREFFKSRVMVLIAISRLKFIVNKWRKIGYEFGNMDNMAMRSINYSSDESAIQSDTSIHSERDIYINKLSHLKKRLSSIKPSKYP